MNIGICIADYGDPELLKNCIASIRAEETSLAPETEQIEINTFDCNKNNIGFTAANNDLISGVLLRKECQWIWLLNNDTIVEKGTINAIFKILPDLPSDVGVVGFKICSLSDSDFIHHAGTGNCFPAGQHKSGSRKLRQFTERTYERWVTFASVLIRREVFQDIGLLDKKMFNFFSDSDFCYRARYADWKVIYEPNFTILHKIGQSAHPSANQMNIIEMDSLVFQSKWMTGKAFFDLDKELL